MILICDKGGVGKRDVSDSYSDLILILGIIFLCRDNSSHQKKCVESYRDKTHGKKKLSCD